jgi:hypothetical protein
MNYCFVENNVIADGPRALPKSWRNISGLDQMDNDGLRELGWLPVRLEEGDVQEKFVGSVFAILPSEVVETKIWRAYTAEEQAEIDTQKAAQVRRERNTKLTECDWTQLNDTPLDNAAKIQWTAYRQALRDVPDQAGFPFDVNWPSVPV